MWPGIVTTFAVALVFWLLPDGLTAGIEDQVLALAVLLPVPWLLTRFLGLHRWTRVIGMLDLLMVTCACLYALGAMISRLPQHLDPPLNLLKAASALWVANVLIFACWYWLLDAGGPLARHGRERHTRDVGAFHFPQMQNGDMRWTPGFIDYLFLAFTTSSSFAPADTYPASQWAKILMMVQSLFAMVTLVVVAARAVNVL